MTTIYKKWDRGVQKSNTVIKAKQKDQGRLKQTWLQTPDPKTIVLNGINAQLNNNSMKYYIRSNVECYLESQFIIRARVGT